MSNEVFAVLSLGALTTALCSASNEGSLTFGYVVEGKTMNPKEDILTICRQFLERCDNCNGKPRCLDCDRAYRVIELMHDPHVVIAYKG